jgi:hypothetical protein
MGTYDGIPSKISVQTGCYCNVLHCQHQFRAWSMLWYQGVRRVMPLVLNHPTYLFRVTI